ncbi:hypothetical protein GCM10009759_78420 [Kitasatospora saccharophila]|uniref:Uncharacterized protein n=1 Tax=Kitasatospora saccharophila TaxID=407973 RepID=A0ABP5K714_9ACTN
MSNVTPRQLCKGPVGGSTNLRTGTPDSYGPSVTVSGNDAESSRITAARPFSRILAGAVTAPTEKERGI